MKFWTIFATFAVAVRYSQCQIGETLVGIFDTDGDGSLSCFELLMGEYPGEGRLIELYEMALCACADQINVNKLIEANEIDAYFVELEPGVTECMRDSQQEDGVKKFLDVDDNGMVSTTELISKGFSAQDAFSIVHCSDTNGDNELSAAEYADFSTKPSGQPTCIMSMASVFTNDGTDLTKAELTEAGISEAEAKALMQCSDATGVVDDTCMSSYLQNGLDMSLVNDEINSVMSERDTNSDGFLDALELLQLVQPSFETQEYAEGAIECAESEPKDGTIYENELAKIYTDETTYATCFASFSLQKEYFENGDDNGDGSLSLAEAVAAEFPSEETAPYIYACLDENEDGQLTLEEVVPYLLPDSYPVVDACITVILGDADTASATAISELTDFDADANLVISADELANLHDTLGLDDPTALSMIDCVDANFDQLMNVNELDEYLSYTNQEALECKAAVIGECKSFAATQSDLGRVSADEYLDVGEFFVLILQTVGIPVQNSVLIRIISCVDDDGNTMLSANELYVYNNIGTIPDADACLAAIPPRPPRPPRPCSM